VTDDEFISHVRTTYYHRDRINPAR
jgi:hypothetical protein